MSIPLLSIVVPTRERADVLAEALAALLSLRLENIEFVICDNASTDQTQEVVAQFGDPRLRYFRSETRISMPENFERGLRLARGRYVMTMGDDDFIIEENLLLALEKAEREDVDLVYWFRCAFYWGSYPDDRMASTFAIHSGRGQYQVDPVALLQISYAGFLNYYYMPGAYNSLISRNFLKRYLDYMRGQYFPSYVVCVDAFSALAFCSMGPSVYFQQSPAAVSGISRHSNGMSLYNGGVEAARFIKELGFEETSALMPPEFRGCVTPLSPRAVNDLSILLDYFNVAERILRYTHCSMPSLDTLAQVNLLRLQASGDVRVNPESSLYQRVVAGKENLPIVGEELAAYFYKLWHIPVPQQYCGRFESKEITVRHMAAHLLDIGFNKLSAA
jgi:hypothetical protein